MTFIVFLGPIAIGAILLLAWVLLSLAYKGAADIGAIILNFLPTLGLILFAILVLVAIILGIRKKSFLHGLMIVLSWSKCILLNCVAIYVLITAITAAGNFFMSILAAALVIGVVCIPAFFEMGLTIKAWETADEDRSLRPVVIEFLVVFGIFVVLCIFGLLAQ